MKGDDVLAQIMNTPVLIEASCVGRSQLFDAEVEGESVFEQSTRHTEAVAICQGCPELLPCRQWADGLPEWELLGQVVAGKVRENSWAAHLTPRSRNRVRRSTNPRRTA